MQYSFTASAVKKAGKQAELSNILNKLQIDVSGGFSVWTANCEVEVLHTYTRARAKKGEGALSFKMLDNHWFTVMSKSPNGNLQRCRIVALRDETIGLHEGGLYKIDDGPAGPATAITKFKGQVFFVAPDDSQEFLVEFLSSESVSLRP